MPQLNAIIHYTYTSFHGVCMPQKARRNNTMMVAKSNIKRVHNRSKGG